MCWRIRLEAALEATDEAPRVDERSVQSIAEDVDGRRRSVEQIVESSIRRVGREPRRSQRGERDQHEQRPRRTLHPTDSSSHSRVRGRQKQISRHRPEREERSTARGARRNEIHVTCAQRLEHEAPKAWPRGDEFDDERAGEQDAYCKPVDSANRAKRGRPRVPQERSRRRHTARDRGQHKWLMDGVRHRLRLKALERRGHRQREGEYRERQMPQNIEHPRGPRLIAGCRGHHASGRQPPCSAARKTNARDVTSGGSDTHTRDTLRTSIGSVPDSSAGKDAERETHERRQQERYHPEQRGVSRRANDERRNRPVVEE